MATRYLVQHGSKQIGDKRRVKPSLKPEPVSQSILEKHVKPESYDNILFSAYHRVTPRFVGLTNKHHLAYEGIRIKMG